MSEPVTLYDANGDAVTVYTRSQAAAMLNSGRYFASAADARAAGSEAGADVEEAATGRQPAPAVEEAAPPSPAPKKATKRPAAKKPRGGDL